MEPKKNLIEYNPNLSMTHYQECVNKTAVYPHGASEIYPLLGLVGEIGEFANKYKKIIRDGRVFAPEDALGELGDILWYLTRLAHDMGFDLAEVAEYNIDKLMSRLQRGVLQGDGDNR